MITAHKSRARSTNRKATETEKPAQAQPVTFPAPTKGWVETNNVAQDDPLAARVLENMFPTENGVRVRGGKAKVAACVDPVKSLFDYTSATTTKLFAGTATGIYDISGLNPDAVLVADVTGQTKGYYSTVQIGTVGGEFLYAVNGADEAQLYNGTTWQAVNGLSTPAITGVTTDVLSYAWKHKNRIWFIEGNTNTAWYLPVDSIGGAAADFSLQGVFQLGGALMFGTTWSSDAGDGIDDRIVFVSTEGEIAVYQGSNPASATDWALVGVFKVTKPLGPRGHIKAGGDVLISTRAGLMPLSAVVAKDPAAIEAEAITSAIEISWRREVVEWSDLLPWELVKWDAGNMLFATLPSSENLAFVANVNSGAWGKYIGWDTQCAAVHRSRLFFGSADGFVYEAESTGADDGATYISRISWQPSSLGGSATYKSVSAARATFLSDVPFSPQLSVSADYNVTFPASPNAIISDGSVSLWDVGLWDLAVWDAVSGDSNPTRAPYSTGWVSQGASGYFFAPQVQITNGSGRKPDAEIASMDLLIEAGGVLV